MKRFLVVVVVLLSTFAAYSATVGVPPSANITEQGIDLTNRASAVVQPHRSGNPLDYNDWNVPGDFGSIQDAINGSTAGDVIHVAAGSYIENIVVSVSVTIDGAGQGLTIIYPSFSNTGGDSGPSFGGSQVIVVQADNVTISNLTVDGDNPGLTSGIVRHGADIDARNGIIEGDPSPVTGTVVVEASPWVEDNQ